MGHDVAFKVTGVYHQMVKSKDEGCHGFPRELQLPRPIFKSYIILVLRTSWGPKYEDQEALGNSRDTGFEVLDFRTSRGHF